MTALSFCLDETFCQALFETNMSAPELPRWGGGSPASRLQPFSMAHFSGYGWIGLRTPNDVTTPLVDPRLARRLRPGPEFASVRRFAFRHGEDTRAPEIYAVAPTKTSKPVSMMFGVVGRSGLPRIASIAFSPIKKRFDRTVDNGLGNSRPISSPLNPKIAS